MTDTFLDSIELEIRIGYLNEITDSMREFEGIEMELKRELRPVEVIVCSECGFGYPACPSDPEDLCECPECVKDAKEVA